MKSNVLNHNDIYLQKVPINNLQTLFNYVYMDFSFLKGTFPSRIINSAIKKGILTRYISRMGLTYLDMLYIKMCPS